MTQSVELLVIENARVFDPGVGLDLQADIVVADGIIREIAPGAGKKVTQDHALRRSGKNRWLLPGFTELSAHLGEPGLEFRESLASGLNAAARGGFTRVCCTPDTQPVLDSPALIQWLCQRAKQVSSVQLLPIAASTLGLNGHALTEMATLSDAGAVAVGSSHRTIESADALRRVLEYATNIDLPVFHRADEPHLTRDTDMNEGETSLRLGLRGSPSMAESIGLHRDILLAEASASRLHSSHLSTAAAIEVLHAAQNRGAKVTAAVPITHLLLNETALSGYDSAAKLDPPLRAESDRIALVKALAAGVIGAVTSDHRPQVASRKDCDFSTAAAGAVGLTTTFSLLLELVRRRELSLAQAVLSLTTGPAAVLGIAPASLRVGEVANLCLVDPEAEWQVTPESLASKCHNSPFLGRSLVGRVEITLSQGCITFDLLSA